MTDYEDWPEDTREDEDADAYLEWCKEWPLERALEDGNAPPPPRRLA